MTETRSVDHGGHGALGVGPVMYPVRQTLQLRANRHVMPELVAALHEQGVAVGPIPTASVDVSELVSVAVITSGSLHGLAAVMRAYFSRHKDRAVLLEPDGVLELKGMSGSEMSQLIDHVLAQVLDAQARNDELWDEVMGPREPHIPPSLRRTKEPDAEVADGDHGATS